MAGAFVGQSLPRPCSGRKTLRRCQNNATTDNVIFIDVDADDVENVIVIDSPELFSKKLRSSSVSKNKQLRQTVIICIDDEQSTGNKHPDTRVKKSCYLSSGASSSKGPSAAADNFDKFQSEVSDDCEFVQEKLSSPVKISKCKRTYSGKSPSRNRYGLGPESDDYFPNSDFLDCELVEEDSSGSVREQWEKAFSKRKYESRNSQTGVVGCSKTSEASHNPIYTGEKVASEQPKEPPVLSCSEKVSYKTEPSRSTVAGDISQDTAFTSKGPPLADPFSKSVLKEHCPYNEANSDYGSDRLAENSSMDCGEDQSDHNLKYDGCHYPNAEPEGSPSNPRHSAEEVDPVTISCQFKGKSETMKEDSSRSPQELQEQAPFNRKSEKSNDKSGNRNFNASVDARNNAPEGSAAEQLKKSSAFFISVKANYTGNLSQEPFSKRGKFGGHVLKSIPKELFPPNKTSTHSTLDPSVKESKMDYGENQYHQNFEYRAENGGPVPGCDNSTKNVDPLRKVFESREEGPPIVPCMPDYGLGEKAYSYGKPGAEEKLWPGRSDNLSQTEPSSKDTKFSDNDYKLCSNEVGSLLRKVLPNSTFDINPARNVNGHPINETSSSLSNSCIINSLETQREANEHKELIDGEWMTRQSALQSQAEESQQQSQPHNYANEVVPLHEKSDEFIRSAESCMISDREKLKETEEYKKAIEDEWASRRQELQIQAEEVKQLRRLKKRKNAERMRLLDMEKRQKQRVEEIRETNKKDEEQMNMKDQIRAEVRNELSKVELSCRNMASLLRSLGIQVGNELRTNADEVRVACKRALFAFHPDRASKSNTRQQVEAEETFKLISRMKEKFSVH